MPIPFKQHVHILYMGISFNEHVDKYFEIEYKRNFGIYFLFLF